MTEQDHIGHVESVWQARAAIAAPVATAQALSNSLESGGIKSTPPILAMSGLIEAYIDAIGDIEYWACYASEYFREKHDLAGTLKAHRERLAAMKGAT